MALTSGYKWIKFEKIDSGLHVTYKVKLDDEDISKKLAMVTVRLL